MNNELKGKIARIIDDCQDFDAPTASFCAVKSGKAARRILHLILSDSSIVELDENQELPAFARVDVEGRPEVGRFYDGYQAGQQDMKNDGWMKVKKKDGD